MGKAINAVRSKANSLWSAGKNFVMGFVKGIRGAIGSAVSAAAQLSPAVDFADLDGNLLISNDLFRGMQVVKGKITLTDLPGIGIEKI